jgi:hypothetical protein
VTKQAATERLSVGNTESLRRFLSNCRNSWIPMIFSDL